MLKEALLLLTWLLSWQLKTPLSSGCSGLILSVVPLLAKVIRGPSATGLPSLVQTARDTRPPLAAQLRLAELFPASRVAPEGPVSLTEVIPSVGGGRKEVGL